MQLHRLYGHERMVNLLWLHKQGLVSGLDIRGDGSIPFCDTCARMRGRKTSVKKKTESHATTRGERIVTDLKEAPVRSHGNHKWAVHFIDEATRYRKTYYLKSKADTWMAFRRFIEEECDPLGIKVQTLRCDGGTEYGRRGEAYIEDSKFKAYLRTKPQGHVVTVEKSPPYTAQMNGIVERYNQTLWNTLRCILYDQQRSNAMWPWGARCANTILNTQPTKATPDSTPYKEWHGVLPDQSRWRRPLCDAFAYVDKDLRKNLDERRHQYIYVGQSRDSPCYLLFNPRTKQTVERWYEDVLFQPEPQARGGGVTTKRDKDDELVEDEPISGVEQAEGEPEGDTEEAESEFQLGGVCGEQRLRALPQQQQRPTATTGEASDESARCQEGERGRKKKRRLEQRNMVVAEPTVTGVSSRGRVLRKPARTNPQRAFRATALWDNQAPEHAFLVNDHMHSYNASAGVIPTPKSIKSAVEGDHSRQWWDSIMEEWNGLWEQKTFEYIKYEDLPKDTKLLHLLWQFKVKPDRLKSRCCLNGTQESEDDYDDIYAPVCRHTTFRTLLWKANQSGYKIGQCDVQQAYLYADNPVEQYCAVPKEFAKPGYAMRLKKMLYGLHASGKLWNDMFTLWMKETGYEQSKVDACLFTKRVDGKVLYVCLYVDDVLYTGDDGLMEQFKADINKRFKVRHLDATTFLGLSIKYDRAKGVLTLGQWQYVEKVLKRFGFWDCKPRDTPMAKDRTLPKMEGECKDAALQRRYRQMVGSLMFLAVSTRPDICYAVKELSRHLLHPSTEHMEAAGRVMRYLRGSIHHELTYTREATATFYGSADADWAGEPNTAKSTTGYAFSLGSGSLSWKAGTQSIVTHSSTEAELVALDEAARELEYLRQLLQEFDVDVDLPVDIFQDNMSTIKLVLGGRFNPKTRHMNVRYHYTHDLVTEGAVRCTHLATESMPSDVLTKALSKADHLRHTAVLLGRVRLEGV
jgi:hypothetical protein